jgi:hypothetical protein
MGDSPSHDCRHEPETTSDFEKLSGIFQTFWSWVISNLIIRCCKEAEQDDQSEEDDHEGQIGAERAQQENEADQGHDDRVVSLAGIPGSADGAVCTICADKRVGRIAGVCLVDPMAAIDDEDDEWEGIAQDKLGNAGNIHGDATHEIPRAADSDQGSRIGTFELEETPHCCLEGNQEAEDAEQGWVT